MLVLLDNAVPRPIARYLSGHTVVECRERQWDNLSNGELLEVAENAGFDVLLTTDKNIHYQQNLKGRNLAIVVLGDGLWRQIKPSIPQVIAAVNSATPGSYAEIARSRVVK